MEFVRRLAIWALLTVFFGSLIFIAYGWTFNQTIADREVVKSWLDRSGAYDNFVDEIVIVSQAQAAAEGNTISTRILLEAANASFTPELLQTSLEAVLDGGYDWLEGSKEEIEFIVDFTEAKEEFAENLTVVAVERVASLPLCTIPPTSSSFDPFTAPCKPAGLNFEQQADDFKRLIVEDENFIAEPRIVGADILLGEGESQQTIAQAASVAPTAYSVARLGAYIALILAFLSGLGIVFIARSKRKAAVKIFRGLFFTAFSLAIFTFFSSTSTAWLDAVFATNQASSGFTERIIKPVVSTASEDLTAWTLRFSLLYAGLAVVVLAGLLYHYHDKKHKKKPKSREQMKNLEKRYRKIVAKKPKVYKKTNEKRKKQLKKKHQKKKPTR